MTLKDWENYKVTSYTKIKKIVSGNVAKSSLKVQLHENKYITALYLSQLAYFKFATISSKLSEFGAKRVSLYNESGTQGYFAELEDMAVVSFRGTELSRKEDLRNALTFWKHPYEKIDAHKGFVTSLLKLVPKVVADVERVPEGKRIIYTGHSMGGALATLLAVSHKPTELCTFGAPRVAGSELEPYMEGIEFNRIVTKWDWIRHLPPNLPFIGYKHVGTEYVLPTTWHWKDITRPHMLISYLAALTADEQIMEKAKDT